MSLIKKVIKSSFFQNTVGMLIVAACILLGAFLAIYENKTNAGIVANEYFECYLRNDFEGMYKYVDVQESEFVDYDAFAYKLEVEKPQGSLTDYTISKPKKKGNKATVTVKYTNSFSGEEEKFVITLVKTRESITDLIPEWRVNIDDWIVNDVEISIPEGATLLVDGNATDNEGTQTEDKTYFSIDRMLSGDHDFYVETTLGEGTQTDNISKDGTNIDISTDIVTLKSEYSEELYDNADEVIMALFEAAKDRDKSYKAVKSYFTKAGREDLKKAFSKIRKILFLNDVEEDIDSSLYEITDLVVADMTKSVNSFNENGDIVIKVKFEFDFTAQSNTSEDAIYYSSYVSEYSGTYLSTVKLYYSYKDGDWKLTDISIKNKEQK
jgi:hypothetical protein